MQTLSFVRRSAAYICLLVTFLTLAAPRALATHLRGGTLTWRIVASTPTTYTVQFTLQEAQRWSFPSTAGSCTTPIPGSVTNCAPVGTAVVLSTFTGNGIFDNGDNTSSNANGTITSVNQAQDYATATFIFTHVYSTSTAQYTATFYDGNRITTLKLTGNNPENISTIVRNYSNGAPVASTPAILSVPLLPTTGFNLGPAVTDIDPNATLVFRLSTFAEFVNPARAGISYYFCPTGVAYLPGGVASAQPPGFSISPAGVVTWNTTLISASLSGGNCGFGNPVAGDLWSAQVMVEAHDKTSGVLLAQTPIDLLMQFVNPVGALPTIVISPATTTTVSVGTPVAFTATGNSTNVGTKITLNANGVPAGANATGLNATVTPPTSSNFTWTPSGSQIGTYVVTYTVTDSNLQQASASKTIVVASLPTISCAAAPPVNYPQSPSVTATVYDQSNEQLNVVWTLNSAFGQSNPNVVAYPNPANVLYTPQVPSAGPYTVTATATDPHGVAVSCTVSVTVNKGDQTITFGPLADVTYGAPDFQLAATASSGAAVTYTATSPTNSCSITPSNAVHINNAGTCSVVAAQAGDGNYNPASNVTQNFHILPAAVTATGGSGSSQYDGTAKTPSACAVTGSFTGDLTCTNAPASVGPDVSTTAITATVVGSNLTSFTITQVAGSYSISQAPSVTTVSCPASVMYNGTAQAACTATTTGVGGLSQSTTVSYSANQNVGTATATASFAGDTNHTASSGTATFTITPAPLSLTAGSYSGVYDGAPHALSLCATSTNYDSLTCTNNPAGPVGPNAGSGVITPVVVGSTSNYTVTLNNGAFTITQAPTTTALTCPASVVYNGTAQTACTALVTGPGGLSQPVSVTYTGNQNVGTATATSSFAGDANHTASSGTATFTITPAPLSLTAGSYTGVYDGSAHALSTCTTSVNYDGLTCSNNPAGPVGPVVSSGVVTPVVSGSTSNYAVTLNNGAFSITQASTVTTLTCPASVVYNGTAQTACTATTTGAGGLSQTATVSYSANQNVGTATASATFVGDANHTASSGTATFAITPAPLTLTAGSYTGVFDGSTHTLSACSTSVNFDGLTCTNNPVGPVGPAVSSGVVTPVASGSTSNYLVSLTPGAFSILIAPSITTISCPTGVTYNGAAQAPCTATVTGIGGLSSPVTVTYTGNVNVGTALATATYSGDANHAGSSSSAAFNINPALLTATAGSYSATYDGSAHALSACTVSANVDGITCSNNPAGPVGPDAGSAVVTPAINGNTANYAVTSVNGSWSISAATVTVSAGSYSAIYDGSAHAPSPCTSTNPGVGCSNNPASVGPDVSSGSVTAVPVVSSGVPTDYTITLQSGSYSITQAISVLSLVCPDSATFTGSSLTPCTATVTGAGGLSQTVPVTYTNNLNVGTATASAIYSGDSNHSGKSTSAVFTIVPAQVTMTAGSYRGTYDGAAHAFSACSVVSTVSGLSCSNTPAGPVGPDVGSGVVTPSLTGGNSPNYTVTAVNGAWSITPLAVTVAAGSYNAAYDAVAHAPSACTSSYAGVACGNAPASVGPGVGSGAVTATPSITLGVAADYTLTSTVGSWSITKAASVVALTCPVSTAYNGSAQTPCSAAVTGVGGLNKSLVVTYANNVVGLATATASFGGDSNYAASVGARTFQILYSMTSCEEDNRGHSILPPINFNGSSVFKQGSVVPVKFELCYGDERHVSAPGTVASFYLASIISSTGTITTVQQIPQSRPLNQPFRFDGDHWMFNLDTSNLTNGNTYVYNINLNDGSTISFRFTLKANRGDSDQGDSDKGDSDGHSSDGHSSDGHSLE